jgi:hypothetical protein
MSPLDARKSFRPVVFQLYNFPFHHATEKNDELTCLCAVEFQYGWKGILMAEEQLRKSQ